MIDGPELNSNEVFALRILKHNGDNTEVDADCLIVLYLNGYIDRDAGSWFLTESGHKALDRSSYLQ